MAFINSTDQYKKFPKLFLSSFCYFKQKRRVWIVSSLYKDELCDFIVRTPVGIVL